MNQRQNHPKKGSRIKVKPFRQMKDINNLKKLLADKPRDFCLFIVGIIVESIIVVGSGYPYCSYWIKKQYMSDRDRRFLICRL